MTAVVRRGSALTAVDHTLESLVSDRVASRLFSQDATLWGDEAQPEASIRLGWTDFWDRANELIPAIETLRAELAGAGIDRVVLCGMGGSSLAPEVITNRAGVPLTVLDSTHPEQVSRVLAGDLARTVVVVSSKSGSTIETRSHRAAFEAAFREAGIDPAERVIIVTDPGSPLEASAIEAGQRVFLADPNVGGRYSALTAFGLVPSGLAGADIRAFVAEAESVRGLLAEDSEANPGLQLAATLGAGLPDRYGVAIASALDAQWGLGDWIEQLIAESTGKEGHGVLPIALPADAPELRSGLPSSAVLATVTTSSVDPAAEEITVTAPLGAQMLLWEVATAVLGRLMGINPFDQPDVESAKVAARKVLAEGTDGVEALAELGSSGAEVLAAPVTSIPDSLESFAQQLRAAIPENGYVAVQAYLDREGAAVAPLGQLRNRLAEVLGAPVTLGWGPRFLHSTGQLHKGGPALGAFLQLLDDAEPDLAIPDSESGFGTLISSQAAGDRAVLSGQDRPVFALRSGDPVSLIQGLIEAINGLQTEGPGE